MKLKLDENLGNRGAAILRAAGHDVATVVEQAMTSVADPGLIEACRLEARCIVTLDLDFANSIRFPPASYAGIAVLRPGGRASQVALNDLMHTLARALEQASIDGKLWIVEHGRIREHLPESS